MMTHWFWVYIITLPIVLVPISGFPAALNIKNTWLRPSSFNIPYNQGWPLSMQRNATQTFNDDNQYCLAQCRFGFEISDQGQLVCDMFAILVAGQLIGLLDVVNDPEFVRNGGWLQPIPAVPSTLGALVRRVTLLGGLWFPISLFRVMDNHGNDVDRKDGNTDTFYSLILFTGIRLGITLLMNGIDPLPEVELLDALRDCYMVALTTISFRYIYRQYLS